MYQQYADQFGTPAFILDCEVLQKQCDLLKRALPNVSFYYALKAFTHSSVIRTLNQQGIGFDIASSGEIQLLKKNLISPLHTIHTHPIKSDAEIKAALRYGCSLFVVDNPYELDKFVKYRHRVGLMLRLSFPDKTAKVQLSKKFGCAFDEALWFLLRAKNLNLHVKGLCFHVGSQSADPYAYVMAIKQCKKIIEQAETHGIILSILDIGGGFPVAYDYDDRTPSIVEFCRPIRNALKQLPEQINVFAEPGRFLVAPAATVITRVIGKARRGDHNWYYLDDGVYGAFSGQIYDHALYPIHVLNDSHEKFPSVLAGPTCDSIDIIHDNILLPELKIGDIVIGTMMGAYTIASASRFNLLKSNRVVVINEPQYADACINDEVISIV